MPDINAILNTATLVLMAFLTGVIYLLKSGTEAAVKTSAEEAAKAAIRQLEWPAELTRELQKTRGIARQDLRYKSYGALWKELRPLAIYDTTAIDRTVVAKLSSSLSNWYFSECGGLLLTSQARNFYFALQDLLQDTSGLSAEWDAQRSGASEGDHRVLLMSVLEARKGDDAFGRAIDVLNWFGTVSNENWEREAPDRGEAWRKATSRIAARWMELDRGERFAVLQQAGSLLRSSLVNDVESRLA